MDYIALSKTVSHALRHEPWVYELELDEGGWVSVDEMLAALRQERAAWREISEADLATMIQRSDKQRYELAAGRIRALYGHSLPGKLLRTPAAPPTVLYHGTTPTVLSQVLNEGLKPMGRQYVHLSVDIPTAVQVGTRKSSKPVILRVNSADGANAGVVFYRGNDRVWLADHVPGRFLQVLEAGTL